MDLSGNAPEAATTAEAPPTGNESSISDNIIASIVKEQQYQEINARVADLEKRLESEQKARSELQAKYNEEREYMKLTPYDVRVWRSDLSCSVSRRTG